jgi:hypothetical protein
MKTLPELGTDATDRTHGTVWPKVWTSGDSSLVMVWQELGRLRVEISELRNEVRLATGPRLVALEKRKKAAWKRRARK